MNCWMCDNVGALRLFHLSRNKYRAPTCAYPTPTLCAFTVWRNHPAFIWTYGGLATRKQKSTATPHLYYGCLRLNTISLALSHATLRAIHTDMRGWLKGERGGALQRATLRCHFWHDAAVLWWQRGGVTAGPHHLLHYLADLSSC